ncbi:hypothetical protein K502DRAFT_80214 [Neoconidiobolus thromboides FSU 785]|nr:hypothetical protein K502DRAFT_80214 [Neoconidiobolus thromboides FSU 785]
MQNIEHWEAKLVGRKFNEGESVSSGSNQVTKQDLPDKHRVLKPDSMSTMDFVEDRLNVHIDHENIVTKVRYG